MPWVHFIDYFFERQPTRLERFETHTTKIPLIVNDWNRTRHQLVLVDGGMVFAMLELYLDREEARVVEYLGYPVRVCGIAEPFEPKEDTLDETTEA